MKTSYTCTIKVIKTPVAMYNVINDQLADECSQGEFHKYEIVIVLITQYAALH
jgi:hypothetical protein